MNYFDMELLAIGENEAFARNVVASFAVQCSPTVEEINDIKTAVSEAVTNAVVHAYDDESGRVQVHCSIDCNVLDVVITDFGKGIADVNEAIEPFFTTAQSEERSGMGFTVMQTFMDELKVESALGNGTVVRMKKVIKGC